MKILIDWIGVTCKLLNPVRNLQALLPYPSSDYIELERGGLGYKRSLSTLNAVIFFDGGEDMGAHLRISGQGCRALESYDVDLFALTFLINSLEGMQFTRLDIACDTSVDILTPTVDKLAQGLYSSKSRKISVIQSASAEGLASSTCYIGSRSSLVFIRIYDKAKEQGLTSLDWYRAEIELKKDYIPQAIDLLQESISEAFCNIIGSYFRPLERKVKPITRSPTAKYWLAFIGEIKKVSLFAEPKAPSVESKYMWLDKQIGPSLALLSSAFENTDWLAALALKNKERLKEKDIKLINEFKGAQQDESCDTGR